VASERVGFEEVRVGDRIRVTYVEGGSAGWISSGVRRSVASRVAAGALGKVWLSEEGHVIAHVGWPKMEIFRLS
jgi:hypothetical protein